MRYGFWLPVFGGWLRNVEEEQMEATWDYVRRLTQRAEEIGYDLTLIAELNLNDIKGVEAPSLDAWSTAAALAAVTSKLELMVAVRPTFHNPALLAKQAANIDHIANGRLTLNVVSSWWADEATKYGVHFDSTTTATRAPRSGSTSSTAAGRSSISPTPVNITVSRTISSRPSQSRSRDPRSMPAENPRPPSSSSPQSAMPTSCTAIRQRSSQPKFQICAAAANSSICRR